MVYFGVDSDLTAKVNVIIRIQFYKITDNKVIQLNNVAELAA